MNGNEITVVGNLTRDPELRFTPSGTAVCSFGLACNRRYKDGSGEWQDDTSFFDVTAWSDMGENVAASLGKGDRVLVAGRMQQREYDDSNGEKRRAWDLVADAIGPDLRWAQVQVQKTERERAPKQSTKADELPPEEPF